MLQEWRAADADVTWTAIVTSKLAQFFTHETELKGYPAVCNNVGNVRKCNDYYC